jgi:hypothetical protein
VTGEHKARFSYWCNYSRSETPIQKLLNLPSVSFLITTTENKDVHDQVQASNDWEGVASVWTLGIDWRTTRACSARNIWQRRRLASYALIIIMTMHKKLLCEWHVSPTRVTVTSLASGNSIFTEALTRYAAILPCKRFVKFLVCFVSFCSISLS